MKFPIIANLVIKVHAKKGLYIYFFQILISC